MTRVVRTVVMACCAVTCIAIPGARAQITLDSLVHEALERNPELVALRAQVAVTRQRPAQARALMPPMADVQVWQWPVNSLNPANTNMYMFMVGQDLPGRGKRDARAAVAEKDIALADADVAIRSRQVADEITQAYFALFIARKATEIHLASVDLLREIADAAQARYAAGRSSQQEALKPVVEMSKLHNEVITHNLAADLAAARINTLRDRDPDTPIGSLKEPPPQVPLPDAADLQRLASARQPEVQRARLEIEKAEAQLASTRLERKPDYVVQGGYQLMPDQTDGVLVRVGVTWPNAPWSRARVDAKIGEDAAAAAAARSRVRAAETMARLAVHEAYVRAKAAQDRADLLRTTILPQAQQQFEVSRAAYEADRGDFQSIFESERTLLDVRLDYFRALAERAQAIGDLERAVGSERPR